MKASIVHALAPLVLVTAVGCSAQVATPAPPTVHESVDMTAKGGERHKDITIRATVVSVDQKNHSVKLKGFDGQTETIRVGPEVKNLPQLKKGDEVVVTYYAAVAFEVVDPKQAKLGAAGVSGLATAQPGDKPGAMQADVILIVADILKIDRTNQQVELRTDKGEIFTVNVERPEVFEKIKVGNRVAIRLTQATAIDVEAKK